MENFLTEAFKKLKLVEEDINLSQGGMIDKGLVDDDIEVEDEEEIIDVNAGDDDEVQDSYVGKIIIMCPCCQSKFYKDKEDVQIADGVANKDEQCAICKCTQGFNILGKVVELEDEKEDDDDEEEEHEEVKESLDDRIHRKHLIDLAKDDDLDEDTTEDEENMPDPWGKDRKKNENFAVRNRSNGRYLDKYFTVTSRDEKKAQKFTTKEEAEKAINPDGKFDTWEDTFEIVNLKEGMNDKINEAPEGYDYERVTTPKSDEDDWQNMDDELLKQCDKEYDELLNDVFTEKKVEARLAKLSTAIQTVAKKTNNSLSEILRLLDTHRKGAYNGAIVLAYNGDPYSCMASIEATQVDDGVQLYLNENTLGGLCYENGFQTGYETYGADIAKAAFLDTADTKKEFASSLKSIRKSLPKAIDKCFKDVYDDIDSVVKSLDAKMESLNKDIDDKINEAPEGVNESVNINATGEDTVDVAKNDDGTMTVNFGAKVEGPGEAIAPLTDEEKDELEEPTEDEIEDVDNETFDEIGESFLTKVYSNVSTFNTTKVKANNDNIVVEGVITYLNGKTRKTEFMFNEAKETNSGHIILEGTNKALTNANKALFLRGSVKDKKFVSESLIYRYASKTVNESTDKPKNIYGRVAIKK